MLKHWWIKSILWHTQLHINIWCCIKLFSKVIKEMKQKLSEQIFTNLESKHGKRTHTEILSSLFFGYSCNCVVHIVYFRKDVMPIMAFSCSISTIMAKRESNACFWEIFLFYLEPVWYWTKLFDFPPIWTSKQYLFHIWFQWSENIEHTTAYLWCWPII